ncbi:MAG: pilus assembly protein N-terminal domain-containing protein [Pelistega sp.]|nr:pilus assembly protein N-terminal domain-containing protein [Pelistega sp.]
MMWKRFYQYSVAVFGLSMTAIAYAQTPLKMQIGDIKVIAIEGIARVAVGDSKVLNANTDDDKELVLFARAEGKTTLEVWNVEGKRQSYMVDIRSAKEREIKEDIRRMLSKIPHVKATIVGEKVIVEGDRLSDADRERVQKLASHYPQIVDMSSQVGWDDMVMIDVQILELPRHYMQELGVKWAAQTQGGFHLGAALGAHSRALLSHPHEVFMETALGGRAAYSGLNAVLSSSIQAMASQGQAVVLAQPQLMARSGATAEFLAGGEVPYSVADGNGNTQTIFKPYGVSLYITPRIEKNGIIRSKINVEVSAVDSSLSLNGGPALKTRRTSTEFNVKSGEPLVLSGFISRDQLQGMERLPGVSDLPILGELFRSRKFQQNETELVIIVRPMVVSHDHAQLQTRVMRSQAIIDSSFEAGPLINVPLLPSGAKFEILSEPITFTPISAEPSAMGKVTKKRKARQKRSS